MDADARRNLYFHVAVRYLRRFYGIPQALGCG